MERCIGMTNQSNLKRKALAVTILSHLKSLTEKMIGQGQWWLVPKIIGGCCKKAGSKAQLVEVPSLWS